MKSDRERQRDRETEIYRKTERHRQRQRQTDRQTDRHRMVSRGNETLVRTCVAAERKRNRPQHSRMAHTTSMRKPVNCRTSIYVHTTNDHDITIRTIDVRATEA